jgi:ParB/RepB/Spo0J family partition protein
MNMEVQTIPINQITVKDRARVEMGEMFELEDSIRKYGIIQPITVDTHLTLVAGHRRLQACKSIGLESIPCVVRDDAAKRTKLELELDENVRRKDLTWPERARLEKKIWDLNAEEKGKEWTLREQKKLQGASSIGRLSMRLQLAEALDVMPDLEDLGEDEAYKELKKYEAEQGRAELRAKTKTNMAMAPQWAEDHYVIGDAINGMAHFLKKQPHSRGEAFHFAEVDPPYGVELHRRKSRNSNNSAMEEYLEWEDFPKLFTLTAQLVHECVGPHAFAVFWYGMSRHQEVLDILRGVGWYVSDIPAIWHKGDVGQTASPDTSFGSCYEPFFVARKGQPRLARPGRGNVFTYPSLQKKSHPTEKPIWLLEEILKVFCEPGSKVLIPFLGSGVTLRAAYKLGHTGMGFDLSDQHKEGFLEKVRADAAEEQKAMEEAALANPI